MTRHQIDNQVAEAAANVLRKADTESSEFDAALTEYFDVAGALSDKAKLEALDVLLEAEALGQEVDDELILVQVG